MKRMRKLEIHEFLASKIFAYLKIRFHGNAVYNVFETPSGCPYRLHVKKKRLNRGKRVYLLSLNCKYFTSVSGLRGEQYLPSHFALFKMRNEVKRCLRPEIEDFVINFSRVGNLDSRVLVSSATSRFSPFNFPNSQQHLCVSSVFLKRRMYFLWRRKRFGRSFSDF